MPHIHEKIDFTVETYIVHQNTVLLRKHDKYNLWLSIGGHIELDEDPFEAAKRECREEVGLDVEVLGKNECEKWANDVQDLPTPIGMYRHPINNTHEHVSFIYFATCESNEVIPENPHDVWQWFAIDDIQTHAEIEPHVQKYALTALKTFV